MTSDPRAKQTFVSVFFAGLFLVAVATASTPSPSAPASEGQAERRVNPAAEAKHGIREGDVLTGVDDIDVETPEKGLEAFKRLRNSPDSKSEVIRSGQRKVLTP